MQVCFFNERIYQLDMTDSVYWHGHVLRKDDSHVLKKPLDFEAEGQRRKGRLKKDG